MTTNTNAALREKLIDMIAEHLSGTYHCLRVWGAWNSGTMSQDDFDDVGESDTPAELADAILAALSTAAQPPAGWRMVPVEPTIGMCIAGDEARITVNDSTRTPAVYRAMIAAAPKAEPAPPDYADAYQGAREDLAIWKRRALEAESALRTEQKASSRLAAEVNEANGPTHLGEPVQPERVPLTDVQIDKYLPLGVAGYSALIGDDEIRAFARAVEATHGIKPAKEDKP